MEVRTKSLVKSIVTSILVLHLRFGEGPFHIALYCIDMPCNYRLLQILCSIQAWSDEFASSVWLMVNSLNTVTVYGQNELSDIMVTIYTCIYLV